MEMPKKKLNHNNNTFKKRLEKQSPVLTNISRERKQKAKTKKAKQRAPKEKFLVYFLYIEKSSHYKSYFICFTYPRIDYF